MKKITILLLINFIFIINVSADSINNISMDIFIEENGTAKVTEKWDVKVNNGTEGYKPYYNLGESRIINYSVSNEENKTFTLEQNWNPNGSFQDKAYKYGINYIDNGLELCWGISNYGRNVYTLKYDITNFVSNLNDAQMVYWTLIPHDLSMNPREVNIKIHHKGLISDDTDVYGYGNYGGTAYVYDGVIEMNSDGSLSKDEYMTILIKFDEGTFKATNNIYKNFYDFLELAEEDSVKYVEDGKKNNSYNESVNRITPFIFPTIILFFTSFITISAVKANQNKNFKKIISKGKFPKDLNYFREIPCNKDIFYGYFLASSYLLTKKDTDFFGALILSWVKSGYITIETREKKGIMKKGEESVLILNPDSAVTQNYLEKEMFDHLYIASKDGVLESKEFEKYCDKNYKEIMEWFDSVITTERQKAIDSSLLVKSTKGFRSYQETEEIYEEAKNLAGLRKFLKEFSSIEDKSALEVHLWEHYLMFAQIFGMADKVAAEFKKLYPDVITDMTYNNMVFIHGFSTRSINQATVAQSRAASYSAGGGGFSSGGGGGGSFGGGGGGGGFR